MSVVIEGDTDLPVARQLAAEAGLEISAEIDSGGKGQLDARFNGYNDAAKGSPWFVLRDLDHDAACPPAFIAEHRIVPQRWMCFRLAVREVEAWLLADAEAMAKFLRVSPAKMPASPDDDEDPTRTIVNLARKSKSGAIRKALVPRPGMSTPVGPLYEAKLIEFAQNYWSLDRAAVRSASLARARASLHELAGRWKAYLG